MTNQDKIKKIADAMHRLNEAIRQGVDAGLTIELIRVSRCHSGSGNWGDQMIPLLKEEKMVQSYK